GATYFGGSGDEFASGVAVDSAGRIYLVGTTQMNLDTLMQSFDMPGIGPSSADSTLGPGGYTGDVEGFIARFDGLFVKGYVHLKDIKNGLAGCRWCPPDPTQVLLSQVNQI